MSSPAVPVSSSAVAVSTSTAGATHSYQQQKPPPHGTTAVVVAAAPPPRGFNKGQRDLTRLLLALTAISLLGGSSGLATFASAGAVLVIKRGTVFSTKNMKWAILSMVSFGVSLTLTVFQQGFRAVDEDRAYGMKMALWLCAKFLQLGWGSVLGLFLLSSYSTAPSSLAASAPSSHCNQQPEYHYPTTTTTMRMQQQHATAPPPQNHHQHQPRFSSKLE
jgi:hypothetical protein